ncbi:bomanin Short 3-like [Drosophila santomea]|uniref:bomanin Short 3-like n=1 Tax=Drosophila santomea TaxID=129105 RepID=UPI001952D6B2|nr:bomanin Short 3-like [Drosophila santomea]
MKFLLAAFLLGLLALTIANPLAPEPDVIINGNCYNCIILIYPKSYPNWYRRCHHRRHRW